MTRANLALIVKLPNVGKNKIKMYGLCQNAVKRLKAAAKAMKREVWTLMYALEDPRTPWIAKVVALLTVSYALSPIDLVPDFIPVLGILDDLILVPIGIWVTIKLIPPHVLKECRERVEEDEAAMAGEEGGVSRKRKKPRPRGALIAAGVVVLLWTWLGWEFFGMVYAWWYAPNDKVLQVADHTQSS